MTFVSRRSPWMIPRPVGAEDRALPTEPLQRLVFGACWRPRALAGSLAGALSRVPGGAPQGQLLERVRWCLDAAERAAELAAETGLQDVEGLIQARLASEPLPHAASWAEVALADVTFGRALDAAAEELAGSSHPGLAELGGGAASRHAGFGQEVVAAMAEEAKNRECLQILIDRWMPSAVRVFGRPGSSGELALLDSRIKVRPSERALSDYLSAVEKRLVAFDTWLPDADRMGIVAPEGWKPRR